MVKVRVELEFDEKQLGEGWMNQDNLAALLYTEVFTRRNLLRINKYKDEEESEVK